APEGAGKGAQSGEKGSGGPCGRHGGAAHFPAKGSHKAMQSFPFPPGCCVPGVRVVQPRVSSCACVVQWWRLRYRFPSVLFF
uniref:Uncharacterized protein n=1 Tax=Junco hyemalis TaxID=40217 RepID=A0A8C5IJ59_JUNHY